MQRFAYDDIAADDGAFARRAEQEAFDRVIAMLTRAEFEPVGRAEALTFLDRFWSILVEDLAHPDNALAPRLKADLASIGIWILRQIEPLRDSGSLRPVIEINEIIRDGLR